MRLARTHSHMVQSALWVTSIGFTMTDRNTTENNRAAAGINYPRIEAMVGRVADAIVQGKATPPPDSVEKRIALRADYQSTLEVIKLLSDIRFRCLVFVTAVITVANALLPGNGDLGTRIALAFVGFVATVGIAVYELRNSQLYEAALHRAIMLERELKVLKATKHSPEDGLFNERPPYVDDEYWKELTADQRKTLKDNKKVPFMRFWLVTVKHDHGLALIYGAALGGWVYLLAHGVLSIPAPERLWSPAPPEVIRLIALLIGLSAFAYSVAHFIWHDKKRFRPEPPEIDGNAAGQNFPATQDQSIRQ